MNQDAPLGGELDEIYTRIEDAFNPKPVFITV